MNTMNIVATTLTSGFSSELLACVGGIGWLLTVYCLWDKFDPKTDKKIHLVSDIVNATFAVVTLVAAVSIAVNLAITLPGLSADIRRGAAKSETRNPPPTLAEEILSLNRTGKLNNDSLNEVLRRQFRGLSPYEGSIVLKIGDNRSIKISRNLEGNVF